MIMKYLMSEGYRAIPLIYALYLVLGGLIGSSVWSIWFHLDGPLTWVMIVTLPAVLFVLGSVSYAITTGIFKSIDDYMRFRELEKKRIK